jgi:hypothetical protein
VTILTPPEPSSLKTPDPPPQNHNFRMSTPLLRSKTHRKGYYHPVEVRQTNFETTLHLRDLPCDQATTRRGGQAGTRIVVEIAEVSKTLSEIRVNQDRAQELVVTKPMSTPKLYRKNTTYCPRQDCCCSLRMWKRTIISITQTQGENHETATSSRKEVLSTLAD